MLFDMLVLNLFLLMWTPILGVSIRKESNLRSPVGQKVSSRFICIGHPVDMDLINKLAALYNFWVLCDAAQAHMAKYKGRLVGSLGDIETFSFHVGKIFTSGEGGAITLNNSKLASWLRLVRGHGMDPERHFFHPMTAFNYRFNKFTSCGAFCTIREKRRDITT